MKMIKKYKQTIEYRRKNQIRKIRISETMKQKYLNNPEKFDRIRKSSLERKARLGYVNSPEARKKVSNGMSNVWKKERVTDKQKQTLFKKGFDIKRNPNQIFKIGHSVPEEWRAIVKKSRAKQIFPKVDSTIEVKIQHFLKELKIEFFTHQHMDIEHGYQCDILIPSNRIVIECFGNYWHKYPYGNSVDALRCKELRDKGWRVLVFWENEIKLMELNDLKEII